MLFPSAESRWNSGERNDLPNEVYEVKDWHVSHLMAQGVVYLFRSFRIPLLFSFFLQIRKIPHSE